MYSFTIGLHFLRERRYGDFFQLRAKTLELVNSLKIIGLTVKVKLNKL